MTTASQPDGGPPAYERGPYQISTDPARLDLDAVVDMLSRSYWAQGRSRALIARSIQHALCFGVYQGARQVGFARVISDRATFAYLADVVIHEQARGQGLGSWLVEVVRAHPELQGLRRWLLATRDAHGLYRKFGFSELARPEIWMEVFDEGGHRP